MLLGYKSLLGSLVQWQAHLDYLFQIVKLGTPITQLAAAQAVATS